VRGRFHAPATLLPGKSPLYWLDRRLGGLRVGLDAVEKKEVLSCRESNQGFPARSPSQYRLSYPDSGCALFWAKWIQSTSSYFISIRPILILNFNLLLFLPSKLFTLNFQTEILHAFLPFSLRNTCPTQYIFLGSIILIVFSGVCKWSLLRNFLRHPATSLLLGPNIVILCTLFSNNMNLCLSLRVKAVWRIDETAANKWPTNKSVIYVKAQSQNEHQLVT
jgi:hypothetical protein